MKLTKSQLKQIIKEEIARSLTEDDYEEEEERMPDAEIFRGMANDLRAFDPYNYPDLNLDQVVELLDQVVELLMKQKDFEGAWSQAQQDEVEQEELEEL
jgi:hypothetical protein